MSQMLISDADILEAVTIICDERYLRIIVNDLTDEQRRALISGVRKSIASLQITDASHLMSLLRGNSGIYLSVLQVIVAYFVQTLNLNVNQSQ